MKLLCVILAVMIFLTGFSFGGWIEQGILKDRYKIGFMDGIQARIDYEKNEAH